MFAFVSVSVFACIYNSWRWFAFSARAVRLQTEIAKYFDINQKAAAIPRDPSDTHRL